MEENLLNEKEIYNLLGEICTKIFINKKPFTTEVLSGIDVDGKLIEIGPSELSIEDVSISTDYGFLRICEHKSLDPNKPYNIPLDFINWNIAMLNYLKEKNLIKDFIKFYSS